MKTATLIISVIIFFLSSSLNNAYAHTPFGGIDDFLKENHIYKEYENRSERFKGNETGITKFTWFPAAGGRLIGAIPGMLSGGLIGGAIGILFMPYFVVKNPEGIYLAPFLGSILGGALLGYCTSFFGEAIIGTPFYLSQVVFYDFSKKIIYQTSENE
ncbi:MAG: hypothetical protein C4522_15175 [Desulfobacteraceae bacterium]|nr:MAG: hypothetical protein C4522_15175 [Desulfobacteraceae bacterium]